MRPKQCLYGFFAFVFLTVPNLGAQQITGRVIDQQTGQPLAAVQVFIPDTGLGALSQQNGRYLLLNVPVGTHTINAQRIGYGGQTAEVTVAAGETVVRDFRLAEQALGLDEIIVTGTPGGTQRRAIGNTVTSVSAADLTRDVAFANVQNVLQGRTPGVRLAAINGTVGAGANVEVRGVGTFNLGRNPLIYVDGIRVNNDGEAGPETGGGRVGNVFNDFNPADIESIEIIKGPAAATLYGTEASAGVIQIITKRGQEGDAQFNVSIRQGVNYIRDPSARVGTQYTCVSSFSPPCSPDGINPVTGAQDLAGGMLVPFNMHDDLNEILDLGTVACARSLDDPQCWNQYWTKGDVADGRWPQEDIFQNGQSRTVDLSVRGGTSSVRYFLQASIAEDEGVVWYNWNDVFRGRANIGVVFNENFSLDMSTGYVQGDTRYSNPSSGEGGIFTEFGWGVGYCIPTISDNDPNTNPCPRILGFQEHLPTDHQQIEATREFKRFTGSATLNFTQGDWLASRAIVGLDQGWDQNDVLYPIDTRQKPVYFRSFRDNRVGSIQVERPVSTNVTVDWSATVTQDLPFFDNVSSQTSVGAQYYLSRREELTTNGMDFASPLSRTINQASISSSEIQYSFVENKSAGFYVQEQLSFSDRFFLTGAVRWDDNSAFGSLRGGGSSWSPEVYPKVSGTWVVSEESFWNLDAISSLRLRGAWGKAGRQPDTFAGVNTFVTLAGMGGASALDPESVGNPEVGPERGTEIELGFDYALFDDRLSGVFTWFSQTNEDALLDVTVPPSFGSGSEIQRNLGQIDNWGWEATLDARIYQSDNFSFDLGLQGSYTMNEIKSLGDFPGSNSIKIGFPYPNLNDDHYILDAEYDVNGGHQDSWGRQIQGYCDQGVVLDGSQDYRGQYGTVLGGARVPCGQASGYNILAGPNFPPYVWSVAPRFSLFDNMVAVSFLLDGAYGGMRDDDTQVWHDRYNSSFDKRCQCNPAFVVGDRYRTYFTQGYFPGDFWKLREIGLRYSAPESLAQIIGAERASLSFSAREVAILWQKQSTLGIDGGGISGNPRPHALDPEIGRNGGSGHRVTPPLTTLHMTLNVTF